MQELTSRYDILKVLGHGGYSAVFKARRRDGSGDIVALKQLDFVFENESAKEYQDFKQEVDILKKMDHPNIIKIYDEFILDNKPALEMEYVDGETLETVLKQGGAFALDEAIQVIQQIASALKYCHHYEMYEAGILTQYNIVHNDINPKNILRTRHADGAYSYILIDFGLSFSARDTIRHSRKEEGMAEYKAPEKWTGGMVDSRSDIYSLGIVIYELLTGNVPFPVKDYKHATDMIVLEEKHRSADIPDICEHRKISLQQPDCDVPKWVELLVKNCLEKQPGRRFASGKELYEFLEEGLSGKIAGMATGQSSSIELDIGIEHNKPNGRVEVIPNLLTAAQQFLVDKDHVAIGRGSNASKADIAIETKDLYMSQNHCQIIRTTDQVGRHIFFLQDAIPSINGTFLNTNNKENRLTQSERRRLKNGDYFWIGNTKIVFREVES